MTGSVPAGDRGRIHVQFLKCRIRLYTKQNLPRVPRRVSLQDTMMVPATALFPICRCGRAARALMWPNQPSRMLSACLDCRNPGNSAEWKSGVNIGMVC